MSPTHLHSSAPPPLTPGARLGRLLAIGGVLVVLVGALVYLRGWLSPHRLTPVAVIDRFEQVNGAHPGFRRNHAKGVGLRGYFESNGAGVAFSRAAVFRPGRVPVIGRFALAGGQPFGVDAPGVVRSMALLFQLPGGEEWRTGMNNIPVFPVNTAEGFYEQLLASAPNPATGQPDPAKLNAFFAKHPEAAAARKSIAARAVSSGFDNATFNSLDAFRFVDANGRVTAVRWSMVPVTPFAPAKAASDDRNALFDALIATVRDHPVQWRLVVTIAEPGDSTSDATTPWPANRRQIEVGTLTVERIEDEATSPARDLNFDPLILPDGIAGSDDPLLSARSAAYARSFTRRESEPKQPSAVSTSAAHATP